MTTGNAIAKYLAFQIARVVAKTFAKLRVPTHTLATVAAFITAPAIEAQGETRLLINCFAPPQHVMCRDILPAWKESVEKATAKRVTIEFPAKSMAPPPAQWESVT